MSGTAARRRIVLTGASDGIGAAAARSFVKSGHEVVLVGRNEEKTRRLGHELGAATFLADYAHLDTVRQLAADLAEAYESIDVLANNAGGIFADRVMTSDGNERTIQVNHLAPFLLTHLLLPILVASRASVIATSSDAAGMLGKIDIADLDYDRRKYSSGRAYADAKLANIMFTSEMHNRFNHQGIKAVAFHPGTVATNFASEGPRSSGLIYKNPLARALISSPQKGASQLVALASGAASPKWTSGDYLEKGKAAKLPTQARDPRIGEELWEESMRRVSR